MRWARLQHRYTKAATALRRAVLALLGAWLEPRADGRDDIPIQAGNAVLDPDPLGPTPVDQLPGADPQLPCKLLYLGSSSAHKQRIAIAFQTSGFARLPQAVRAQD